MRLLTDEVDRESYRRDETPHVEGGLPLAVALPRSTADVSQLVQIAAAHRTPLVARGAGSGLSGGSAGIDGAVTVAFTRMNRILEIDRANGVAVVEPGVINADLKRAVAAEGLFYAPDPASYEFCTIGGNLGTNAGGLCCVKYGVTRDSVLALEVVLADGAVVRTGGKTLKDVAGYDLTGLFVGSQGTLGLITQATVRLRPAPPPRATMLAFFPTLEAAGIAVSGIPGVGAQPCTLELMDRHTIAAVDDWHNLGLDRTAAALLLIESDAPGGAARDELARVDSVCSAAGATSSFRAADSAEGDWLRQVRRLAYQALERTGVAHMEDVGVPLSRVPEMLEAIERIAARHDLHCATFGHAGDGNLHPNFVVQRGDHAAAARVPDASAELYRAALELGGTVTAEHGIGLSRRGFLERQRGPDAVRLMRTIKQALDPLGILNPGKVLPDAPAP